MDKETARYILGHCSNLMSDDEKAALTNKYFIEDYDKLEQKVAERMVQQNPSKVFFNNCPKCNKLARTPFARQCRYCGHSWRDRIVGQFKLNSAFQLLNRPFFLLGQITNGEVTPGNFIDLTMLGLNVKPKIEAIGFARINRDWNIQEDIGLGINELSEEDKQFIQNIGTWGTPLDIINLK
jgi:hypothetical protein